MCQQEDIEIINVKKQPCSYRYKTILSSNILGVTLPPFICGILRVNPKTGLYQLTDDQKDGIVGCQNSKGGIQNQIGFWPKINMVAIQRIFLSLSTDAVSNSQMCHKLTFNGNFYVENHLNSNEYAGKK